MPIEERRGLAVERGQPVEHVAVVLRVGVVVDDVRLLELPGRHDVLHPLVEREERIERGVRALGAPCRGLRRDELGSAGLAAVGEPVGAGDRRREPVDHQVVEQRLDLLGRRQHGVGGALGHREALDPERADHGRRRSPVRVARLEGSDAGLVADRDAELAGPSEERGGLGHGLRRAGDRALEHLAGAAVDRDRVAGPEPSIAERDPAVADLHRGRADHRGDAPAAGHDGGVAGEAARRGQDPGCPGHAVDVVRARSPTGRG